MNAFGFAVIVFLSIHQIVDTPTSTSAPAPTSAPAEPTKPTKETLGGLKFRGIGPALSSGRIGDFAVDPNDPNRYFVAVASGGIWKTTNGGTTFKPVFDGEGSYSIGCLAMDPKNSNVVWAGTGENNSQRSVSFGDGVYVTRDGGKNWENVGLKQSEHIGRIVIDPRDSDTVYVAAQGPLWRSGGDRGLYKTTDGGKTWAKILHISDDTGINEIHMDPTDPRVLYAAAYQRRRHVWTLVNGGPESAIYKSTDAGATWRKINKGLPEVELGRIGLAVCPVDSNIVYAIVEAAEDKSGFFRSTDKGETWEKQSSYISSSPQYYNEIVCDPKDAECVYALDTFLQRTQDGGKTFSRVPNTFRHVDDHALWINPRNTNYLLMGCDGGIYSSADRGETWRFYDNLPVTQFYRVTVDNSKPFYYVYGGTQDNNTLGGPSRTLDRAGITNDQWFVTVGGDGFESQVDPEDPNIVYSLWQYGGLVRHDRRSGETIDIRPREKPGEDAYRWNWDSPLLISAHDHKRLYFAANRLFRSDDQGNGWKTISPDLTRQLNRDQLKVMGRIQPPDAVAKHNSTSFYGNIVSLAESPLDAKLLYAGTDDGLIQVSEEGGDTWRRVDQFPGIPERTYVSCLVASRHDANTVYAAFDNHKMGDFKPYVLRSPDRGRNWVNISGDLPVREIALTLAEDHVRKDLLFLGTEFGIFSTLDGGARWLKMTGGMPTIAVRDIDIQRRENDLVLATFGRSFYILDDYSPLRELDSGVLDREAAILPIKPALRYIPRNRLGNRSGRGWMGAAYYAAPNPPYGAIITYYLKDKLTTRRERRKEAEKKARESGATPPYPTLDELRAEDREKEPSVWLVIKDASERTIRRVPASREKGLHRAAWDLRHPGAELGEEKEGDPWDVPPAGLLAPAGKYTATLAKEVDGTVTPLADAREFEVVPLNLATFAAEDREAVAAFEAKFARLDRAVDGATHAADEARRRIADLRRAALSTPGADPKIVAEVETLRQRIDKILIALRGDPTAGQRNVPMPPSIQERVGAVVGSQWHATSPPTKTQQDAYRYAGEEFAKVLTDLRTLVETDLRDVEARLEAAQAPWTPGRLPDWKLEEE